MFSCFEFLVDLILPYLFSSVGSVFPKISCDVKLSVKHGMIAQILNTVLNKPLLADQSFVLILRLMTALVKFNSLFQNGKITSLLEAWFPSVILFIDGYVFYSLSVVYFFTFKTIRDLSTFIWNGKSQYSSHKWVNESGSK